MKQRERRPGTVAAAIEAGIANSRLTVVTYATIRRLAAEINGDTSAAVRVLYQLAEKHDRPVGLNYPTGPGTTRTAFLPPPGWSPERLAGYVAGQHENLTAQFGAVARVTSGTGLV